MRANNSGPKLGVPTVRQAIRHPTATPLLFILAAAVGWAASLLLLLVSRAAIDDSPVSVHDPHPNGVRGAPVGQLNPRQLLDQPETYSIAAEQRQQPAVEKDGENTMNEPNFDMYGSPPPARHWLLDQHVPVAGGGTSATDSIPRVINKVFLQKSGGFANPLNKIASLRDAHSSWTDRNPGYEMMYFDLQRCRSYLSEHYHPVFLRAFDCLQPFAAKADFFRYALIYREGGWYSDWKTVCLIDGLLDYLSRNGTLWVSALDRGHEGVTVERCMQTSFFGASPRHPVLEEALSLVLDNIHTQRYGDSPIHPTGPCAFGEARKRRGAYGERGSRIGVSRNGHYVFDDGRAAAVRHKCESCGEDQNWGYGNNYNDLYQRRHFYCEDAPSLFHTVPETMVRKVERKDAKQTNR